MKTTLYIKTCNPKVSLNNQAAWQYVMRPWVMVGTGCSRATLSRVSRARPSTLAIFNPVV